MEDNKRDVTVPVNDMKRRKGSKLARCVENFSTAVAEVFMTNNYLKKRD